MSKYYAARADQKRFMARSFLWQDGSNELSHTQIHPRGLQTCRTKHLLLYRYTTRNNPNLELMTSYITITCLQKENKSLSSFIERKFQTLRYSPSLKNHIGNSAYETDSNLSLTLLLPFKFFGISGLLLNRQEKCSLKIENQND